MNYLGFEKNEVKPVIYKLNQLLADYHVYYQNLRNFHWNIQGENFFDLHEKFENLYNDAKIKIDEIAERILTLRATPVSKLSEYLDLSIIKEGDVGSSNEMVEEILKNHQVIIKDMRDILVVAEESKDEGTTEIIGGFLSEIEKSSWMLDAWLSRKREPVSVS